MVRHGPIIDWVDDLDAMLVTVEYRLAPEHPYPAPIDDCYAGLVGVEAHQAELGFDPDRLVIAGASAGRTGRRVALKVRDEGGPGWPGRCSSTPCSTTATRPSRATSSMASDGGTGPATTPAGTPTWATAERPTEVPIYAAPARATDLSGLPPTFIDVGSAEVFRDEDVAYASQIWADGGDCELHVWPGGFHAFDMAAPARTVPGHDGDPHKWLRRTLCSERPRPTGTPGRPDRLDYWCGEWYRQSNRPTVDSRGRRSNGDRSQRRRRNDGGQGVERQRTAPATGISTSSRSRSGKKAWPISSTSSEAWTFWSTTLACTATRTPGVDHLASWDRSITILQTGAFFGMKWAAPALLRSSHASVINISSIFGATVGFGTSPAYHAAKGAVSILTKTAALHWAQNGIRVTRFTLDSSTPRSCDPSPGRRTGPTEAYQTMVDATPMGRLGRPEEVAAGVAYFASDDATFITGTELYIDGGYMAQ